LTWSPCTSSRPTRLLFARPAGQTRATCARPKARRRPRQGSRPGSAPPGCETGASPGRPPRAPICSWKSISPDLRHHAAPASRDTPTAAERPKPAPHQPTARRTPHASRTGSTCSSSTTLLIRVVLLRPHECARSDVTGALRAGPIESARTVCCSGSAATELCAVTSGSSRSGGQVFATRRTRNQHVKATRDTTVVSHPAVRQGSDAGCLTLVEHRTIKGHVAPREPVCR